MSFTLENVLADVQESRNFFLRHLAGLTAEQWDWKPYAECKSIRDTVCHVVGTDDWTVKCLTEGAGSDIFMGCIDGAEKRLAGKPPEELIAAVTESRERIYAELRRHNDAPLETPIKIWGEPQPIGSAVAHLSSEDFYHAGQVAFIRMATNPEWDYYRNIYGISE